MAPRKKYWARCSQCRMRTEHCFCALIPTLTLSTKVILLIHKRELNVPTNTGRLAALALKNSVILEHGQVGIDLDVTQHLRPGHQTLLLYPADNATVITPDFLHHLNQPIDLIVPDGNWRQASKMRRRHPSLACLPTVKIAPGPPSAYRVRQENKPEGLATIEAIARALGVIEGYAIQQDLEKLMAEMVQRTLISRGALPKPELG